MLLDLIFPKQDIRSSFILLVSKMSRNVIVFIIRFLQVCMIPTLAATPVVVGIGVGKATAATAPHPNSQVSSENLFNIDKYLSCFFSVCQICQDRANVTTNQNILVTVALSRQIWQPISPPTTCVPNSMRLIFTQKRREKPLFL